MYAEATQFTESLDISLTNDSLCNASKSVSNKLKEFFVLSPTDSSEPSDSSGRKFDNKSINKREK